MPDLVGPAAAAFVAGAAERLGHECGGHIAEVLEKELEAGWQRDYEAGGIAALVNGNNEQAELEPA